MNGSSKQIAAVVIVNGIKFKLGGTAFKVLLLNWLLLLQAHLTISHS